MTARPDPFANSELDALATAYSQKLRREGALTVAYRTQGERDRFRAAGRILEQRVRTTDIGGKVVIELPDWATDNPFGGPAGRLVGVDDHNPLQRGPTMLTAQ